MEIYIHFDDAENGFAYCAEESDTILNKNDLGITCFKLEVETLEQWREYLIENGVPRRMSAEEKELYLQEPITLESRVKALELALLDVINSKG